MKIALISTSFFKLPVQGYSGLEQVVWNLACNLTKIDNNKVVVFATKGSSVPPNGFLIECGEPLNQVNVDWLEAEKKMWNFYKKYLDDFDIINSHNWLGFPYASKVEKPQLKICQTMHGYLSDWWTRSKPPFKLNMIAISDFMVNAYAKQGIIARRCYNGIDTKMYKFKKSKGDRFLFLGRISKIKGAHVAIEIAKKANVKLDVVGATNFIDDPAYVEQVKSMCDGDKIRFVGEVSQEDKIKYLQNAKGLIVPGRWGEPFGLHLIEALSVGCPVIAFNDGAVPEIVKEGGIICSDQESMVSMISQVSTISPTECRKNAERFSVEIQAKNYQKLFNCVLSNEEW